MIAVLGASGLVGSYVADELAARKVEAFAVVRRDVTLALPTRTADLRDVPSLRNALLGARRLLLLTAHGERQGELEANALAAAQAAGIEHIVKISGGAATLGPNGVTATAIAHWHSEQAIERSGLGFTFLRPSFYAQNLLAMVAPLVRQSGLLPAPFGKAAIAMVDARDVAASAVAALLAPQPEVHAWRLTGPRAVTLESLASRLGVRVLPLPSRAATWRLRRARAAPFAIEHAGRMAMWLATGADASTTDHVQRLTGRPPRPVEHLLDEHRDAFVPRGIVSALTRSMKDTQ